MPVCDCNQGRLPCSCKKTPRAVAEFALLEERPILRARVAELEGQLASASDLDKSARQLAIEELLRGAAVLHKAATDLDLTLEEETHG